MGLDVYVGSLTRYYAGNWETIVQRVMREAGQDVIVLRPNAEETEEHVTDTGEIERAVLTWRSNLSGALGQPLTWVEDATAPYFTNKPAWDGYGSLQVLAASVELGRSDYPRTGVEDWSENDAWRAVTSQETRRFSHLYFPQLWFPVDLPSAFQAPNVKGTPMVMGSSERLLTDLQSINNATFRGTEAELAQWRFDNAEYGGPFEATARFGLAVFLELASKSVSERLPMLLDY